tara:strand:- start:2063 stop:2413 length:351 start_codon:yes stop_codon:yes gene_type:complete
MITEQEVIGILEKHAVRYFITLFGRVGNSQYCSMLLDGQLVTLNTTLKMMLIGPAGSKHLSLTWDDWFRFDETDIEYRGVDLEWWKKHKPVLQELVQLIESNVTRGPSNCRPDVCP